MTSAGRTTPFVILDPTVGRYLASAGAWTTCVEEALCLPFAEATAWVARMSCEPYRLCILQRGTKARYVA